MVALRIRATTASPGERAPIALPAPFTALALPRNDTLLTSTTDGALTRWELGDAPRAIARLPIGVVHTLHVAAHADLGFAIATDAIVVFDRERYARFAIAAPTRFAWMKQRVAMLDEKRVVFYGADGSTGSREVAATAFDAEGDRLVFGTAHGGITVDDRTWAAHDGEVIAVKVLADTIVTVGRDGMLRTWDLASGRKCSERSVVDRDATLAAVQFDAGLVRVTTTTSHISHAPWDEEISSVQSSTQLYTPTGERVASLHGRDLISPDGRWLLRCSPDPTTLHDLRAKGAPYVARGMSPTRTAAALVGGARALALVPMRERIERWDFVDVDPAAEARPLTCCTELRFLSEHVLASAHANNEPWLRDATTAAPRRDFGMPSWKLRELRLVGQHLVHSEYGPQLLHLPCTVFDGEGQELRTVPADDQYDRHVAIDRDCFVVVTRTTAPRVELRDIVTDAQRLAADLPFYDRAWVLPDGRLALFPAAYRDEPMLVWELAAARAVATIAGPTLAARRVVAGKDCILSYCPPTLSGSGPLTAIVLWRFAAQTSHVLEGHTSRPTCVAFIGDDRAISADATSVIAWDLATCTPRWSVAQSGAEVVRFHFGGELVLVERGIFGPHLVLRHDGTSAGTIAGQQPAFAGSQIGVIDGGELVLYDADCTPIARWRGAASATTWAPSERVLAVGDACGDVTLLDY